MLYKKKGGFGKRDAPWYRSQAYKESNDVLYKDLKRKEAKHR